LLRLPLLNRLAAAKTHAGRLLHYHPDQLSREPLAAESCAPVPTAVARTPHRLTLDSDRQVARISAAMYSLNGQLKTTAAEELVCRSNDYLAPDALPRDIVLELNTRRSTRPVFWPGTSLSINRPDFPLELAKRLFGELGALDDFRLTLAGVGDPLLCPEVFEIIDTAKLEARAAIHVETDLLGISADDVRRLAESPIDVISVHLPAMTAQTYAWIMGCDGYGQCLENIRLLVAHRHSRARALPIVVPIFTKCTDNLGEMEAWYDQWLRALGSAVIRGPSACAGQIPDVSVADMSPPGRTPCARLASRLTILSDGNIVSCQEDVLGAQPMGRISADSLANVWQQSFESMRKDHRQGEWEKHSLCRSCREWNRP
jgi:radical SAM protein with 4Fe4S-binding SPASM domain